MLNKVECDVPKKKAQNPWGGGEQESEEDGHFHQTVGGNQKSFLEKAFLSLLAPFQDHPGLCREKHREHDLLSPLASGRPGRGLGPQIQFHILLNGLWATLHHQSINTIDLHVPGNAVLLGRRGSWLHFCIKGSD